MQDRNLPDMFFRRVERYGDRPRYRHRVGAQWRDVSWREMAERVRRIAAALLDSGARPGDRVVIMSASRAEWCEADLGILSAGCISVPIYPSSTAEESAFILWNAGARIVFVDTSAQLAKLRQVQREGLLLPDVEIPDDAAGGGLRPGERVGVPLELIVVFDGRIDGGENTEGFEELLGRGERALGAHAPSIEEVVETTESSGIATIVYTSGTTGPPKGVVQTHANHLVMCEMIAEDTGIFGPGDEDFLFLPLAHSFARLQEFTALYCGSTTVFARSVETVLEDLHDTGPHLIPAVPRVYEKIYARIHAQAASSPAKRAAFTWAVEVGRRAAKLEREGRRVPPVLAIQRRLAHELVFKKLHEKLGGRVKYFVSGGAPLSAEIAEFFHAMGLVILEGYGLTETTPALCINRPRAFRFGTVGRPLSGVTLKLLEDGELLAKGPNIAQGYYRRPGATAEAWDADGWFHTGDIAEIDDAGYVRIVDRKKELIVTAGGKNIAPQNVENLLKTSPYISGAMLYGDKRPYCVALITLNAESMRAWAEEHGKSGLDLAALGRDADVIALIQSEVDERNKKLARYETVKAFAIVYPDFTQEGGELTPSLKLKRRVVVAEHRAAIEALYHSNVKE